MKCALTLPECGAKLSRIQMIYKDTTSCELHTRSPNSVSSKMMEYVMLLPEEASDWDFCLPCPFFNT